MTRVWAIYAMPASGRHGRHPSRAYESRISAPAGIRYQSRGIQMVRVLFVCMGNICRSPTAEGVFRSIVATEGLIESIGIDSAGTHAYHVGEPPDRRAQQAAQKRGVDLSTQRARRAVPEDFHAFDLILAMDQSNYQDLESLCPHPDLRYKLRLFMEYAPALGQRDVPDPYYGGPTGFERVLDMIEAAAQGLLEELRTHV